MISLKKILLEAAPIKYNSEQTIENLEAGKNIVNGLMERGFSYINSVALAGNMSVESFNALANKWFSTNATDGTAYGLMQWQGARLTALKAFAKYNGSSASNLSTQLDFVKFELMDGYLLYPNDKTKKAKEQLIPGIPVSLVYIVNDKGKPSVARLHYPDATTETKDFMRSSKSTIKDTTSALTANVFRPGKPHVDRRVSNAIAIDNYMKSGTSKQADASNKTNTNKQTDTPNKTNNNQYTEYTIKQGETLSGIANRHNTTVDAILKKNPGLKADSIKAGQKIKI